jgi:diacylglycerol kinase family enzyme
VAGIGVVLNPKSGRNLRDPTAAVRLARRLGDKGVVREARSIDELYRIAEDFRRAEIDVLAISGGDGTNHVTLSGFLDVYAGETIPKVALLRGGTMNTVANSVGVGQDRPEGLLGRLVRGYALRANGPLYSMGHVERRVMKVSAEGGGGKAKYGFLFGTGVVHGFLAEYYGHGETNPLVAAKVLAGAVASAVVGGEAIRRIARPFRGTVELTGDEGTERATWPTESYLAVAAGTIAHIGLSFKPFHRYAERSECFHVLGIHSSPLSFVRELPRIHRGDPMRPGKAHDALTNRMTVRSNDGVVRYMIDGDLHEHRGALTVEIGPRVRLLVVR